MGIHKCISDSFAGLQSHPTYRSQTVLVPLGALPQLCRLGRQFETFQLSKEEFYPAVTPRIG